MKGFYITIKNGLLDPKHIKAMGGDRNSGTVWLFMWLLDKMTIIDVEKGEGKVLGGKPIRFEEVKKDLGISRRTYIRWIEMLRKGRYIKTERTPYGLKIIVFKAFKVFKQRCAKKGASNMPSKAHLKGVSGASNIRQDSRHNKRTQTSSFSKKPKPFFRGQEMRYAQRKWWVLPKDGGQWLEFAGEKKDIVYK